MPTWTAPATAAARTTLRIAGARHVPGTGDEVLARREERPRRLSAPERPVVPAADDRVMRRDAEAGEPALESGVLREQALVRRPRVEPDVRVSGPQQRRSRRDRRGRAVPAEQRLVLAENRGD